LVVTPSIAFVSLVLNQDRVWISLANHRGRTIMTCIVHDDDLDRKRCIVPEDGRQALSQEFPGVPAHDDDADQTEADLTYRPVREAPTIWAKARESKHRFCASLKMDGIVVSELTFGARRTQFRRITI